MVYEETWTNRFDRALTRRGVSMILGCIVTTVGMVAIFLDIKGQGHIDIKSPFMSGQVSSGHVGVLLLFLGIFLVIVTLCVPTAARHRIEVNKGKCKIVYTGRLSFHAFDLFLRTIREVESDENMRDTILQDNSEHRGPVEVTARCD